MPDDRTAAEALRDFKLTPDPVEAVTRGRSCKVEGRAATGAALDCPLHGYEAVGIMLG